MKNNISFDTYLFISPKQFTIYVSSISDFKKIYEQKIFLELDSKQINFFKLENFLNENIFKIEKVLKNFIKKIIVIIDFDVFFPIQISVKKKNHGDLINLKSLSPLLNEAKDCCKKTIGEKKIIHMIIDSYQINDKHSSDLPKNLKCNNFSLDVSFICLSNTLIKNLEEILKKYQISLSQIISANYIKNFLVDDEKNIFFMTKKIIEGHNPNEVMLIEKTVQNQGFFEKFFNFFS